MIEIIGTSPDGIDTAIRNGLERAAEVPPNLLDFVESAGLAALAYAPPATVWCCRPDAQNFWISGRYRL